MLCAVKTLLRRMNAIATVVASEVHHLAWNDAKIDESREKKGGGMQQTYPSILPLSVIMLDTR